MEGVDSSTILPIFVNKKNNKHDAILVIDDNAYLMPSINITDIFTKKYANKKIQQYVRKNVREIRIKNEDNILSIVGNCSSVSHIRYQDQLYYPSTMRLQNKHEIPFGKINKYKIPDKQNLYLGIYDHDGKYTSFKNKKTKIDTTIITLTSSFTGMPSAKYLSDSLQSIKKFKALSNSKSIIVADGIKKLSKWDNAESIAQYEAYKVRIKRLVTNNIYPFNDCVFLASSNWNGPTRNLKQALDISDTDLIFFNQHDLILHDYNTSKWSLDRNTIEKHLDNCYQILMGNNQVKHIFLPRTWEINGENHYNDKHKCIHPKVDDITKMNGWFLYGDKFDFKDTVLLNVKGFSDAQAWGRADFFNQNLMSYAWARNRDRFIEDQIHSALKNDSDNKLKEITDGLYLLPLFISQHTDLKSKNKYLGLVGLDDY